MYLIKIQGVPSHDFDVDSAGFSICSNGMKLCDLDISQVPMTINVAVDVELMSQIFLEVLELGQKPMTRYIYGQVRPWIQDACLTKLRHPEAVLRVIFRFWGSVSELW